MNKIITLLLLLILVSACTKNELVFPKEESITKSYLFLGHTRTNSNPYMDSLAEKVNYDSLDMLWLGGDLAKLTSVDLATISHVDSIYNLGSPQTLWALGNHDYSNLELVAQFTEREPFYTYYRNGITFLVLDTQDSLSNIVGAQRDLFNSVVDTISNSSHLILIHHKLFWMYGNPDLEPIIDDVSNGYFGDCFYCVNPNNFYDDIYPKLVEVKNRGIEVLCIAGDIGFYVNEFQYVTNDGIYFLASGLYWSDEIKKGLLFSHNISKRTLTWEYKLLSEL